MNKKHIVCYGDSNTYGYDARTGGRFDDDIRWTQVLAQNLGADYLIAEEGVSGRTTVFDDSLNPGLNGLAFLPTLLSTHSPLDLLIIMLGTNDCKERFAANGQNIADGVDRLVRCAKQSAVWNTTPRILIIAPILIDPKMYQTPRIGAAMGAFSAEKSHTLPAYLRITAQDNACYYMDCNDVCTVNDIDFMHLDEASHLALGAAVAAQVRSILGE